MLNLRKLIALCLLLVLAACGGGGGSKGAPPFGNNPTTPPSGGGNPPPVAAGLTLTLSAASIQNSGSESVTATATAVDANRNVVSGIPVQITVDSDAIVQPSGPTTGDNGNVTGAVRIGSNKANRVITVTATSGTLTATASLRVVGSQLAATALPGVVEPGAAGRVQFRLTDATNTGMSGFEIAVTGPGGVVSTGTTDANGDYEYRYTAPGTAGPLTISASAAGVQRSADVVVQGTGGTVPPVPPGSVFSASVSANPSVVSINEPGSTDNRVEIRALFVGSTNQPIRNVRVRFDLAGDLNSIGGTFASGTSLVYSDANGIALTSYISGNRASPTDGVTIRACWSESDFPVTQCPRQTVTRLTVVAGALSVTIGTDNLVVVGDLVYSQRFVIQVNDAAGVARPGADVSVLLDLPTYKKGQYGRGPDADRWEQSVTQARCDNEDLNRNGVLETYGNGTREDANSNGQLDPRKADVAVAFEGGARTNSAGQAIVRITYPQNTATWVTYFLTVSARGIGGTEGRATFGGTLLAPFDSVRRQEPPPFVVSPYGVEAGFPALFPNQDGSATFLLCTR